MNVATIKAKVYRATVTKGSDYEEYTGEYEVTPTTAEQVLETTDKVMTDDVTVHKIPTWAVSNDSGTTFIIAES